MEKEQQILFLLKSYLVTKQKGTPWKEYVFSMFCKIQYKENKVLHYEKTDFLYRTLEFELIKIDFNTNNKDLDKSIEFLHRTFYRYDGLKLNITPISMVIENKASLLDQWKRIRSSLQADYKGIFADDYIIRINSVMESPEVYNMPVNNYFYYGLMFLGTPHETSAGWNRSQQVVLSDFDDTIFEENMKHEMNIDDKRCFSIMGKTFNESSDCQVNKFYGRTQIPVGSLFPDWTQLEVDYTKGDFNVYWKYELIKQEEE